MSGKKSSSSETPFHRRPRQEYWGLRWEYRSLRWEYRCVIWKYWGCRWEYWDCRWEYWVSAENLGVSCENIGVSHENIGVSDKKYWDLRWSGRRGLRWNEVSDGSPMMMISSRTLFKVVWNRFKKIYEEKANVF